MGYFKHDKAMVHPDARIGEGTRVWANTNIQSGAVIGNGCNICDGTFVEKGAVVGNHVTIKHYVSVFDGVTIEDDVFIGSNIAFINDRHPRSNRKDQWVLEKTLIKKGATLGSNVTILCGLTVGEYAFIGAGSVVTKDVPAYGLVYGNPARLKGYVCQCGRKLSAKAQCAHCGKKYRKSKQGIMPA
jgi:acetyltransferase-like isoleucine patch superfamily enzyme